MRAGNTLSNIGLVVVVLCALTVTGLVVKREFAQPPGRLAPIVRDTLDPSMWVMMLSEGHRMGGEANADLVLVEFADFECPACQRFFREVLQPLKERHGSRVSIVYQHWPMPYHRLAYPSARAAECAAEQGRFEQYHDLLFTLSDSLGLKSFESFAQDAGVRDSERFNACNASADSLQTISRSVDVVRMTAARGTPTIVVDGVLYLPPPSLEELEALLQ